MTASLQLLKFESTDGFTLPSLLYEPKRKTQEIVLYLHGNGSSSVFYESEQMNTLGSLLAQKNISFFAFNNRGAHWIKKLDRRNNNKEERVLYGMTYELIKECIYDIDGAVECLKTLGYNVFYLMGVSTGANKVVVYHHYRRKNPISKYILLSGGDDTGLYYETEFKKNRKKFFEIIKKCKKEIEKGNGQRLVPKYILREPLISYQSLYDTINPDGDYNIFPFNEYINKLKLSKKPLFSEYKEINKPTLVVYGEFDEYCYGNIPKCVEILKKECPDKELFTFKIIKGADHGFSGKEKELAETICRWI
jgi:pimeloyl-ACP methyl ester carboxylesterase